MCTYDVALCMYWLIEKLYRYIEKSRRWTGDSSATVILPLKYANNRHVFEIFIWEQHWFVFASVHSPAPGVLQFPLPETINK